MLSEYEETLVSVAAALRTSKFANRLQHGAPGRRGPRSAGTQSGGPSHLGLAEFELSLGIPVQRTLYVLEQMKMGGYQVHLSDEEREYVQWVYAVWDFLRAVADRFWWKIPERIRSTFFDDDNAPSYATTFIPGLRDVRPPDLRKAADAIGVSAAQIAELGKVWGRARRTPAWRTAWEAVGEIRSDATLFRRIQQRKHELRESIWRPSSSPMTVGDHAQSVRQAIRSAAAEDHPAERRLRAYNQLIQLSLSSLLGLLEDDPWNEPVAELRGMVAVSQSDREFGIRFTSQEVAFLHPGEPFVLLAGGPLDGVYQCTAFQWQASGQSSITDVQGRRLSDLEGSPRLPSSTAA